MEKLELTAAEKEMIQIQRQQKELEEKEKQTKRLLLEEMEIAKTGLSIANDQAEHESQVQATIDFCGKMSSDFNVSITERKKGKELYHWNDGEKLVYYGEDYIVREARIIYTPNPSYTIHVNWYFKYNRFGRSIGKGCYKMYIHGITFEQEQKGLINPKLTVEKILQNVQSTNKKKSDKEMIQSFMDSFTYPNATLKDGEEYLGSYEGNKFNKWTNPTPSKIITLNNGIVVTITAYVDGGEVKLRTNSVVYPKPKPVAGQTMELLEKLTKIQITIVQEEEI